MEENEYDLEFMKNKLTKNVSDKLDNINLHKLNENRINSIHVSDDFLYPNDKFVNLAFILYKDINESEIIISHETSEEDKITIKLIDYLNNENISDKDKDNILESLCSAFSDRYVLRPNIVGEYLKNTLDNIYQNYVEIKKE